MENRIEIKAGNLKEGDTIDHFGEKKIITGLGKSWKEKVTDDTACCYGMEPGLDYYPSVELQYAYYN